MDQYHAAGAVTAGRFPEIGRPPSGSEIDEARRIALGGGLRAPPPGKIPSGRH